MKISIVGLGSIARVLATAALEGGHHVEVIGRDEVRATALAAEMGADVTAGTTAEGAPTGDLVILAVPYASAATVVGDYGTKLLGKVVVDITNPFDRTTFTDLVTPRNSSGAEEIAKAAAPGVPIVKAFNSVSEPCSRHAYRAGVASTSSSPATMMRQRKPSPPSSTPSACARSTPAA